MYTENHPSVHRKDPKYINIVASSLVVIQIAISYNP